MELRCVSSSVSVSFLRLPQPVLSVQKNPPWYSKYPPEYSHLLSHSYSLLHYSETSSAFLLPPAEHPGKAASMDIDNAAAVKRILFFLYNFCIFILPSHFV